RLGASIVRRGGDFDRWDLEVRGAVLGSARMLMGVEEHGQGRQMVRVRLWPRAAGAGLGAVVILAGLAAAALLDGAGTASAMLALAAVAWGARLAWEGGAGRRALGGAGGRAVGLAPWWRLARGPR